MQQHQSPGAGQFYYEEPRGQECMLGEENGEASGRTQSNVSILEDESVTAVETSAEGEWEDMEKDGEEEEEEEEDQENRSDNDGDQ